MHANETTRIDYLNQDITEHPAAHKKENHQLLARVTTNH
jgi:hypothetical protein